MWDICCDTRAALCTICDGLQYSSSGISVSDIDLHEAEFTTPMKNAPVTDDSQSSALDLGDLRSETPDPIAKPFQPFSMRPWAFQVFA